MLVNHKALEGKLVHAWTEPTKREVADGGHEATRYKFIVDESDHVLGTVSDRYKLVLNRELVAALDVAADAAGMRLEPAISPRHGGAAYENGRSRYVFTADREFRVAGDSSALKPTVILKNSYRGNGGIRIEVGIFRVICTNGMIAGTVAYHNLARHVGGFDTYAFVEQAVAALDAEMEKARIEADRAAAQIITAGDELLQRMLADTAQRYAPDLERAVRENTAELGQTEWAYMQAAAETATHRMQERSRFNMAADVWQSRMARVIAEHINR